MENELNKLIEQQNKEYEIETHQLDDDTQSNCDIDDFEQRLKSNKSRLFNDNDSDSDDDFRPPTSNTKKPTYQPQKQSRPLLSEEPDLFRQVQQMHQNKSKETFQSTKKPISVETTKTRQEAQQRAEDEKLLELLNSNNTGLKDKKLKELIQKNKELYVNLEKEKSTRQKLQKEIERIKEETDMQLSAMGVKVSKGGDANKTDDSMDWKKKYNDLERKLQEVKLQNTTLKNDFNKAMRVITREIGENISIDAVLSEDNTWKGRAQQIEVLKARVKELQAKVSSTRDFSDMSYMTDKTQTEMGMMGTGKSFNAGGKAKDRREELENVKIQCEALKAENDSLSEKVKALNSRKTVLEKENREMKGESERVKQILKEKSDNDDKYIAALKKEVERLKDKSPGVQTRIVYRDKPAETKRTENEDIDENLAKKELFVLKNELDKKEKIIKELISDKLRNTTNTINKENFVQETSISDQEKFLKLETMIKLLKQENEELSNMKLGIKAATPDSKVIKDLSLQNAQLRRKVDDLQQKLKAS